MEKKDYSALFQPIRIGGITVSNRFAVPGMSSRTVADHHYLDYGMGYYAERGRGGYGLVITEFTAIDPHGLGNIIEPGIWDDRFIPSLHQMTEEFHKSGKGHIFCQLHHAGVNSVVENEYTLIQGPSDYYRSDGTLQGRAFSNAQVYEIIDKYVVGAVRAKKAGFDGVEVHGAHGYLLCQFLNHSYNKRTDEFGGSMENRFRIVELILRGIKKACGEKFPVGLRINAYNAEPEGCSVEDYVQFAKMAEKAGADYIHVSNPMVLLPYYKDPGYNKENTKVFKEAVTIPVIAVGRVNDEDVVLDIVEGGYADIVACGRQSVCDPHFPDKVKEGRFEEIFHCLACGQRCHNSSKGCEDWDQGASCMINPFSGKETRWTIIPTIKQKKITVIGAGPAGLQAAWVLAARGHQVTVYEKDSTIGGTFRLAAKPNKKAGMMRTIDTYAALCKKYGVIILCNHEITKTNILELDADHIIVATGSTPYIPPIEGLTDNCHLAEAILSDKKIISGKKIAVLGGGSVGLETAEYLLSRGNQVDIIEMADQVGIGMIRVVKYVLLDLLKNGGAKIHTNTRVQKVYDNKNLKVVMDGEEKILEGYDEIVAALGYRNYDEISQLFDMDKVSIVGDAKKARDAKYAIFEATKIALEL